MKKHLLVLSLLFVGLGTSSLMAQCMADFTYEVDCNCVTFTPAEIDSTCTYTWNFGLGGNPSNQITPTFCYPFTGGGNTDINVSLLVECQNGGVMCSSSESVTVQQIPDVELVPVNAPGWIHCAVNPANPNFNLFIDNASSTEMTNAFYIVDWGDTSAGQQQIDTLTNIDFNSPLPSHVYPELASYLITVTVVGLNGCSANATYEFINSSASPDIGLELDGLSNVCVGYEGVFIVSNTEDNPPDTRYIFQASDSDTIIIFSHPIPDTIYYTFNRGSCGDTCTISSVTYPNSFCVSITAVVDSCGSSSTAAVGPIRIDEPPQADFEVEPASTQCVGDLFNLINTSTQGVYNLLGTQNCSDSTYYFWSVMPSQNFEVVYGQLGLLQEPTIISIPGSPDSIGLSFNEPGEYTLCLEVHSVLGSVCPPDTVFKNICVLPIPEASFTTSSTLGCAPFTVDFTNTSNTIGSCGAAEYAWTVDFLESECGLDSSYQIIGDTSALNTVIQFNSSGQYEVQLRVVNQCDTAHFTQVITIAQPSIVEIDEIPDDCVSTSISPSFENLAECYAPASCTWYITGPSGEIIDSSFNCNPGNFSYNEIGTYEVMVIIENDCGTSVDTETFSLFSLPEIPTISSNSPVCVGDDLCLTVTDLGPNEVIEWTGPQGWMSTSTFACITDVTGADAGIYQFLIRDTLTNCENDTAINLIVQALPALSVADTVNVCLGQSQVLTVSPFSGNNATYTWSPSTFLDTVGGPVVTTLPTATITYIVTAMDTITLCENFDTITVVVDTLPLVSAGLDFTACAGQNTQLMGTPPGGFYTGDNVTLTGLHNGNPGIDTVWYHFQDGQMCEDSAFVEICVLSNPIASFDLDMNMGCGPLAVATTNTSNTLNDCEASDYTWSVFFDSTACNSDSTGWSFTSGNANSLNPEFLFSLSGTYTIQLQVANQCDTSIFNRTVIVGEPPTAQILVDETLCDVYSVNPMALAESCNGGGLTYQWAFPGALNQDSSNLQNPGTVTYPDNPGTDSYQIFLTVTNTCGSSTEVVTVQIFELPTVTASSNSPVCAGETAQLFGDAGTAVSFNWTGPNGFESDEEDPLIAPATLADMGDYILTVTDANGCMNSATTTLEVLPLPPVNIVPMMDSIAICIGDSIQLEVTGADTYTWVGLGVTDPVIVVGPTMTTEFVVIGLDTVTGCSNNDTITVVVNPLPVVEAGADTFVCAGSNLTLQGSPLGGEWTDSLGMVIPGGIYNQPIPGIYTLFYTFTDLNACVNTDSLEVCVLSNPVASFDLDTTVLCVGESVAATNTSNILADCLAGSVEWNVQFVSADCHNDSTGWFFETGGPNTTDASFGFTRSGIYTIQLTVANACDTVATSQTITVGEPPQVSILPFADLCNVFSFQPMADVEACNSSVQSYDWTFPGSDLPTFSGPMPPVITYPASGTYSITLTVTNNCGTSTGIYDFEIFELPQVEASNPGPICAGEDLQLIGIAPTADSVAWTDGIGSFFSNELSPLITNIGTAQSGIYTMTVWDSNGCSNADTTLVQVLELPTPSILGDDEICIGESTTLTVSPGDADIFTWSPASGLDTTAGTTVIATPTINTTYMLEGLDTLTGCTNFDTIEIIVNPLPVVDAGPPATACINTDLMLNGTPNNPPGFWESSTGSITPNGVFNAPTSGVYTVFYTYTDGNGCSDLDSTTVCVVNEPVAGFDITSTTGCTPFNVDLTNTSNTLTDCEAPIYTWEVLLDAAACHMNPNGWLFTAGGVNSTDVSLQFTESGVYTVQLTVTNVCGASVFTETVVVGAAPEIAIAPLPDLCAEFSITPTLETILDCDSPLGAPEWNFGPDATPMTFTGTNPGPVSYTTFGSKTISVTVSNACGTTTDQITFTINELPGIMASALDTILCAGENLQLFANGAASLQYQWSGPLGFSSSQQNPVINNVSPAQSGTYTVTATDPLTACVNNSSVFVQVNALPIVSAGGDLQFCPDDGLQPLVGNPVGGQWSGPGVVGSEFDPAQVQGQSITLTYTFTDNLTGCTASDEVLYTVAPVPLQQTYSDSLCIDETILINGTEYGLDNPSGVEVFINPFTGCDSLILQVNLGFWEVAMEFSTTDPLCFGASDGSILIDTVWGGTPPYAYILNQGGEVPIFGFPTEVSGLGAGLYDLTVVDAVGCEVSAQDILLRDPVEVALDLGPDLEVTLGDEIELEALIFPGVFDPRVIWEPMIPGASCDSCTNPIFKPLETATYSATYISELGCRATDDITITVDRRALIYVPNAFSPNGDGINDVFYIHAKPGSVTEIKRFLVFDRWGEKVYEYYNFQPNNPASEWDGWFRGQLMDPQVFAWFAEIEFIDGRVELFEGDITLVR